MGLIKVDIRTIIALFFGVIFFIICISIMKFGHLHEDAYILFQYSRNLSNGFGITFDATHGPAEGATDFLWMSTLGLLSRVSGGLISIGIIAALLNSIGMLYLTRQILSFRKDIDLFGIIICIALLLSGGAEASIGGFATLAYGSIYALVIILFYKDKFEAGLLASTILSLFRPDGLFLSMATITSYLFLSSNKHMHFSNILKKVVLLFIAPLTIYFIWRYYYFGLIAPLPLLIKQRTDIFLEGLKPNLYSLKAYLPFLIGIGLFRKSLNRRLLLISISGGIILFILLMFAHQSQNVGFRFQFPIHISLFIIFASSRSTKRSYWFSLLLLIISIVLLFPSFKKNIKYLVNSDYINSFPQILSKKLHIESIAITEAGRFPYWYNSKSMTDLVGLNSKDIILKGPSLTLEENKPNLIFIHHAGRFKFPDHLVSSNHHFFIFNPQDIHTTSYEGTNTVLVAPIATLKYAINQSMLGIAVKYGATDKNYSHVYFISKEVDQNNFLQLLDQSFKTKYNYLDSERATNDNTIIVF